MHGRFRDRTDAGRQLAAALRGRVAPGSSIVLGLPRGGVPVAFEVAAGLGVPLDVLCVRKLGFPFQPELAMGAIASGGAVVRNDDVLRMVPGERAFEQVLERERMELQRRERKYRGDAALPELRDLDAVIVDDGLATGATMEVAARAVRALGARSVVVAVPVASPDAVERLRSVADRVVSLQTPMLFGSVGQYYERFDQTEDDEVIELLARARRGPTDRSEPSC